MKNVALAGAILMAAGSSVSAQVIDGDLSDLGGSLWAQDTNTAFGDNGDPSRDLSGGSEIDNVRGFIANGKLYLGIAGNLETNFNKLDIFIDAAAGVGQNRILGGMDNPDVDFSSLQRMGDDGSGNGLTFDAGFDADYFFTYTGGNNPAEHFANGAVLLSGGGGAGGFLGGGPKSNGPISGAGVNGGTFTADFDNSNTGGVAGFGSPVFTSDPASVTTGFELVIDLAELGWDGVSDIKVAAFVNGGGHDFLSNQVVGGLGGGMDNLGEPRNIDFSQIAGNQFVTIAIPAPGATALLGLGALAIGRRRR